MSWQTWLLETWTKKNQKQSEIESKKSKCAQHDENCQFSHQGIPHITATIVLGLTAPRMASALMSSIYKVNWSTFNNNTGMMK